MDMRVGQVRSGRWETPAAPPGKWRSAPALLVAIAAVAAAAAIQSLWVPIDGDVSWLITVSERVIAGDRLYVDILEVNPPASVWIYLPLVWAAGVAELKAEAFVAAAFMVAALASIFLTLRLASGLDQAPRPMWLVSALLLIALVMPMGLFAQREHLALLLAFPALATLALIAEEKQVGTRANFAAGVAAGLIVVIKPYFLIAVIAPAAWAAWQRRSLAPLLPGIAGGSLAMLAYSAAILVFASDYLEWLPVIARTYGPMHEELWKVATGPAIYPAICVGLAALLRPQRVPALAVTWLLGAAGFLIAAYLQAKNYPNHWLPQSGLAMAAIVALLSARGVNRSRRLWVASALAFVALAQMRHWTIIPEPAVAAEIHRVAPAKPKIITLGTRLITGHPVSRNVEGQWVGSRAALFTAAGARFVGLHDPAVAADYRQDIETFVRDVESHQPDVVLVETASKPWLMREPAIARTMAAYRPDGRADEVEIWVRRATAR